MTPYAILLVKPTDSDELIRKTYWKKAEKLHPDRNEGFASPTWYTVTAAYVAIKTADARNKWAEQQEMLAGQCDTCDGIGVKGTRMFKGKIRLCEDCKGEGRVV